MPLVNLNTPVSSTLTQPAMMRLNDPTGGGGFTDPTGGYLGLLGGLGALGGGLAQAGAQNSSASLAQQYARMASQLGGFGLGMGPGGINATGSPWGAGGQIGLGGFNPAYGGLAGLTGSNVGTAGGIGAPAGLNPALSGAFGTAAGGLAGFNPAGPGYAGNADLMAAGGLAGGLNGGFGQQVTNQYNALQALQSPANINAANSLGNSLFGRGMLGSSSGGILAQQFGQGLAQQSAADAAAASGLGIQALGTQANAATGLTWMGSNALNSAFSNFGNASMLAPNVQASYLNPAMMGITGAGNLTNTGLGLYNAGLQSALGQNQAAARAGYLGTTNANSPNQQSPYGQLLGNLFGGLAANGGQGTQGGGINNIANSLRSLFGGSSGMTDPFGNPLTSGNIASAYNAAGVGSGASVPGFGLTNGGLVDTSGWGSTGLDTINGMGTTGVPANMYGMSGSDISNLFGPSAAGGEAASTGGSVAGDVLGGGGAAAAGAELAPAAGAAAAPTAGLDTMALAQSGYASLGGVPGSLAAADTTAGGAGAGAGAGGFGLGAAGAIAAPLALALFASGTQPYTLNQDFYNRSGTALAGGFAPGQSGNPVLNNAAANPSRITPQEWQQFAQYGITPQNIQQMLSYFNSQPGTATRGPGVGYRGLPV